MDKSKKEIIIERIQQDNRLSEDSKFKKNINTIFEIFGEERGVDAIITEYKQTSEFEQKHTEIRWKVYTILSSISFGISGYVLSTVNSLDIPIRAAALFFAWFIHLFATIYYWWMHSLAHVLRNYLEQIESLLGFSHYTLRSKRPVSRFGWPINRFKFHWMVYATSILYLLGIVFVSMMLLR